MEENKARTSAGACCLAHFNDGQQESKQFKVPYHVLVIQCAAVQVMVKGLRPPVSVHRLLHERFCESLMVYLDSSLFHDGTRTNPFVIV